MPLPILQTPTGRRSLQHQLHRLSTVASLCPRNRTTAPLRGLPPSHLAAGKVDQWARNPGGLQRKCQLFVSTFHVTLSDMKKIRWVWEFSVIYSAGITPSKRLSHQLYATLMTTWISAPSVSPPSVSPRLSLLRPPHLLTVQSFLSPDILTTGRRRGRAGAWLGGSGVGAGAGCYDLRNFCTNGTKRVLNCTFKTRSVALAQPPALLLLPGGPDMCTFFQPNSQWFTPGDVTKPEKGARRLGFISFYSFAGN